jgi:hypothetical protein
MKKLIFTFISCMIISCAFSQATYYWVGGSATAAWGTASNWNTALDGSGTVRVPANTDILIFDGTNIGGAAPATGTVSVTVTTITIGKLILQNGADVALSRATSGTSTFTIGDDPSGDDLVVNAGTKLRVRGTTGSLVILLSNNAVAGPPAVPATSSATAKIFGDIIMEEGSNTIQNRFTSRLKGAFVFASGSSLTANAGYAYYPFSSTGSSLTPVFGGVVFQAGSSYYLQGGLSPFGSSSQSYLADFQPGSNFYFRTAAAVPNMFANRSYGNVIIDNNITADGTINRINNLTINPGFTFTTHSSGSTPVTGNIVNNGSFVEPAADPNRNNRIVMAGDAAQTIGGSGTFALADFIISNASNVKLLSAVQVDSSTTIYGTLRQDGSAVITGSGTTTLKTPASVFTTGLLNVDSVIVKNISDFTGVEIGMGISGANVPANTVVVNFSSGAGTITLSKPVTGSVTYASAATTLNVFNGAAVLPVGFENERATLINGKTNVSWSMQTEDDVTNYVIERSASGTRFDEIGRVHANHSIQYSFVDEAPLPGVNYYRIKALETAGQIKYSNILRVVNGKGNAALQVYPNPVKDKLANVQLSNLDKGAYTITVFNQSGQKQFTKSIAHAGGAATLSLALPATVKAGMYILRVDGAGGSLKQQLIVQ